MDSLVDFIYHSQKIEGCKLSYGQTEEICLENKFPKGFMQGVPSIVTDTIETLSQYNLFKFVKLSDTNFDVLGWHKYMFINTKPLIAGTLRSYNVYISGSKTRFPDYHHVKRLYAEFEKWWLNEEQVFNLENEDFAFKSHFKLVRLHPFGDGNGRISRFLMNYVLNSLGTEPLMIIKFEDRWDYYRALESEDEKIFVDWCKNYYKKNKVN